MPINNSFRHQVYAETRPTAKYSLTGPCLIGDGRPDEIEQWRQTWCDADVDAVYLVHGTFTGNDVLGVVREIQRFSPHWGATARELGKSWVDRITGDTGNYSEPYRQDLATILETPREIPVRRFSWSGENHHTARAEAAVQLLDLLLTRARKGERHVVLWGHSHAGNLFALITNLIGGNADAIKRFFHTTRAMNSDNQNADVVPWQRVHEHLCNSNQPHGFPRLTIVTFGTPIRYGWETQGYHRLLHFVHHRPNANLPEWRTEFPFGFDDLLDARHGDYIQQLGIAGTDFLPSLFSYARWQTENRLKGLIEHGLKRLDVLNHLRFGMRVPDEGFTVLVDYPDDTSHLREQLLGHAVYTKREWLGFHLREITQHLFS